MADEIDEIMNEEQPKSVEDLQRIAQELCEMVNMKLLEFSPNERLTTGRQEAKTLFHEMLGTYHLNESDSESVSIIFAGLMKRQAAVQIFGRTVDSKMARMAFKSMERKLERQLRAK